MNVAIIKNSKISKKFLFFKLCVLFNHSPNVLNKNIKDARSKCLVSKPYVAQVETFSVLNET